MLKKIFVIHVHYHTHLVGTLFLRDHRIFFEYSSEFLKTGLELSPFKLPLKHGVVCCENSVFDGLFGVFNDSLPDGWGRLVLDRKLLHSGLNPEELSPLDRLSCVGSHGMGALIYKPETKSNAPHLHQNLDEVAEEARLFQEMDDDRFLDDLLLMGGSSTGARPKILVQVSKEGFQATKDCASQNWMIKFRSPTDPRDVGSIEYAYHLMAKACDIDVPEAKLFPSKLGSGYFGVRRFDFAQEKRIHMHTASGLLHADHRLPSLDYQTLLRATLFLTKDIQECEKQFAFAAFNVFSHNRDDHAKNFSYLMNACGAWSVSPAYDLIFSHGPSGEHTTSVMGEGKNPRESHLLKLAEKTSIPELTAKKILQKVKNAVANWPLFAKEAQVSKESSQRIQKTLQTIL